MRQVIATVRTGMLAAGNGQGGRALSEAIQRGVASRPGRWASALAGHSKESGAGLILTMRTVAIIQARMGSNRLPGKVLRPILGKPMLWYIVHRVRAVPSIDEVVVAVPDGPADEELRKFCAANDIASVSGSELDVLDRFYHAAQEYGAD